MPVWSVQLVLFRSRMFVFPGPIYSFTSYQLLAIFFRLFPVTGEMIQPESWKAAQVINLSRKSVVRIVDLPDITSTICCRRTYIARNKINYPKMLPDMVTVMEKIIRFLRKSTFYTHILRENKGASSLFSLHRQNCPSASYIQNFKPLTIFCGCTDRLVFELVGNHRVRVSCVLAQISNK